MIATFIGYSALILAAYGLWTIFRAYDRHMMEGVPFKPNVAWGRLEVVAVLLIPAKSLEVI